MRRRLRICKRSCMKSASITPRFIQNLRDWFQRALPSALGPGPKARAWARSCRRALWRAGNRRAFTQPRYQKARIWRRECRAERDMRKIRRLCLAVLLAAGAGYSATAGEQASSSTSGPAEGSMPEPRSRCCKSARWWSTPTNGLPSARASSSPPMDYHVVSQVALEPKSYRLEYTASTGRDRNGAASRDRSCRRRGGHQARQAEHAVSSLRRARHEGRFAQGEHPLLGNPLNLGFTVVEGSYSGPVDRSYNEHCTGALNPGMSGGPAIAMRAR